MKFGRRKQEQKQPQPFLVNDALRYELQDVRERLSDGSEDRELDQLRPSYWASVRYHYHQHRRHLTTGFTDPTHDQLYRKNDAADFARLNGIPVPQILGRWRTPEEIEWDALPERFVIKSTFGGGGISVFPVTRSGVNFLDGLSGETLTREEIVHRLAARHQVKASYFAEEYLPGPANGSSLIPYDVKAFCFYGEVPYLEVRSDDGVRSARAQTVRVFRSDGTEILDARPLMKRGADLPTPAHLAEIVAASEKMSANIRRPFVRLDFFDTDQGIYFGEVSALPGRQPLLRPDVDRELGEAYEDALARLYADLAREGCLEVRYGDQPLPTHPDSVFSPSATPATPSA